ncbi:hypothetical protein C2W62_11945 [Candidatus Entotheonella serta]|nr:hypothetical protein C2W62_11945 [Candidatus Entotheonella serta]
MERPDLDTLACVNAECPLHRKTHQGNLGVRKVYGRDAIRLLRCRTCGEEFSERRGTALVNTKVSNGSFDPSLQNDRRTTVASFRPSCRASP